MRKHLRLLSFGILFFSAASQAHVKPVIALTLGADNAHYTQTSPTIFFGPPIIDIFNTYVPTNSSNTKLLGGVFLGAQFTLNPKVFLQLGASYYQNSDFQPQGDSYQQGSSSMINSYYQYDLQSQRVLAETKILCTVKNIFHPYVDVGIGEAFNRSSNYAENPYAFNGGNTVSTLTENNHTTQNFTYIAGLGVDMNLTKNLLIGLGYRYADLGTSSFGGSNSGASSSPILQTTSLTSNEYLFQITAIC